MQPCKQQQLLLVVGRARVLGLLLFAVCLACNFFFEH